LTFRINYSRKTHGITQIVAQEFDAAENLTERALEVNVACASPKSSRINPATLAAPRNERLSFFCPCEQFLFSFPDSRLILKVFSKVRAQYVRANLFGRGNLSRFSNSGGFKVELAFIIPAEGTHYDTSRGVSGIPVWLDVPARGGRA
jgi:hypothetical protein